MKQLFMNQNGCHFPSPNFYNIITLVETCQLCMSLSLEFFMFTICTRCLNEQLNPGGKTSLRSRATFNKVLKINFPLYYDEEMKM